MQTTQLSGTTSARLNNTAVQLAPTVTTASSSAPHYSLSLHSPDHPHRAQIEDYIARRYARRHQASIEHYMPHLLALEDAQRTRAVLGMNSADKQALFLECYLDKPVEQAISQQLNTPVDRAKVVEIGNLAASQRAASHLLFTLLSALLDRAGYRWLVFTATPCVRSLVENMGFTLHTIGEAKAERMSSSSNWGSYYETHPQVMVGCIDDAMRKALSPATKSLLTPYQPAINAIADSV
ncbi:MAG: thermostable hemolysin [Gammaproteobacteria bacterium]|nr:thermostable hemolysin [Gammaproteobacteria bacterium]MBQ0838813.1 thermostable hemolysin [Gammaproteobacteria bacterium]